MAERVRLNALDKNGETFLDKLREESRFFKIGRQLSTITRHIADHPYQWDDLPYEIATRQEIDLAELTPESIVVWTDFPRNNWAFAFKPSEQSQRYAITGVFATHGTHRHEARWKAVSLTTQRPIVPGVMLAPFTDTAIRDVIDDYTDSGSAVPANARTLLLLTPRK